MQANERQIATHRFQLLAYRDPRAPRALQHADAVDLLIAHRKDGITPGDTHGVS